VNRLRHSFEVAASVSAVFSFYTNVDNVPRMAMPDLNLRILRADRPMRQGARILFATRPRFAPLEVTWFLEIADFKPNEGFTDRLIKGPFSHWEHRHEFRSLGENRTAVEDSLEFGSANPLLDRLAGIGFVVSKLNESFRHRERVVRESLEPR